MQPIRWNAHGRLIRLKQHCHIQDIKDSKIGELHISSPGVLMDMYFPRLVTEYRKQYPGIRICISERGSRSTEKDILDGSADIGLVMLPLENPHNLNVLHFPKNVPGGRFFS